MDSFGPHVLEGANSEPHIFVDQHQIWQLPNMWQSLAEFRAATFKDCVREKKRAPILEGNDADCVIEISGEGIKKSLEILYNVMQSPLGQTSSSLGTFATISVDFLLVKTMLPYKTAQQTLKTGVKCNATHTFT